LFCDNNRDIWSFDHAWNLASLRVLTLHELAMDTAPSGRHRTHPKMAVVDRIAAKLADFRGRGEPWPGWIAQAEKRVAAGYYHPHYTETWMVIQGPGSVS
jgi:hypothetical protein